MRRAAWGLIWLVACSSAPPEPSRTQELYWPTNTFWVEVAKIRPRRPTALCITFTQVMETELSIQCRALPAVEALSQIGELARVSISIAPELESAMRNTPVSLRLRNIALMDALDLILMQVSPRREIVYGVHDRSISIQRCQRRLGD
ncbi:MAG: hypothetical protein AAGD14_11010 [Planctomycetota bacterium]